MAKTVIIAFLVAIVTQLAKPPAMAGTTGVISGYVRDSRTHKPIAAATAAYYDETDIGVHQITYARTSADGFYVFISVAPGTYWEVAYGEVNHVRLGLGTCTRLVSVVADQTTTATFDLYPEPLIISHIPICRPAPRFKPTWSQLMYPFDESGRLIL
jgi:hypothetical protein